MNYHWILASTSPRRQELLKDVVSDFQIQSPNFEEKWNGEDPQDYVKANAIGKNRSIELVSNSVILSADTIVELSGEVLEKPKSFQHAVSMLQKMSGVTHRVMTGYCLRFDGKEISDVVTTEVVFRKLNDDEIQRYVESGEPMDKAGSYGIQGKARSMIEEIHGSYTNVMGLPLSQIAQFAETLRN